MMSLSKKIIVSLLLCYFSIGCATAPIGQTVCRHNVLRDLAFLQEKQFDARVVIYQVDLITSHAQAQIQKDSEWLWVENYYGDVYLSKKPERKLEGWIIYYTPQDYIEEMGKPNHNLRKKLYQ